MTTVRITDAGGGTPTFTQWDVDRVVIVSGVTSQPCLHFANAELKRAIVVPTEETSTGSGKWKADVPNFILQFPLPIVISVFLQPDGGEGQTVATVPFGVQPKKKPQDYDYTENIGYINWLQKTAEIEALIDEFKDALNPVFWATYGTTTNAEIETAYQAGKIIACKYNRYVYYLCERQDAAEHVFSCVDGSYMRVIYVTDGVWGHDEFSIVTES